VNSNDKNAQTACADSFAPFSRAGAVGETGDFNTTDLSTRLDQTTEAVFFVLISKIYSRCSRNMSKDIENRG